MTGRCNSQDSNFQGVTDCPAPKDVSRLCGRESAHLFGVSFVGVTQKKLTSGVPGLEAFWEDRVFENKSRLFLDPPLKKRVGDLQPRVFSGFHQELASAENELKAGKAQLQATMDLLDGALRTLEAPDFSRRQVS